MCFMSANDRKVVVMHILTFILLFVIGSISVACKGDYSGIAAIGKFVGYFVLFIGIMWLFTQPVLLSIGIIIAIVAIVAKKSESN